MPVKLKQWHYAQAPQPWHSALVTFRLQAAHLRALCAYYNNLISEPFLSRALVYNLYDQIVAAQKHYIAAKDILACVSEELEYFEDPDRMTWITRLDRRKYQYESAEEEEKKELDEQVLVRDLSEAACGMAIDYSGSDGSDNDSETSSQTSDSTSGSSTDTQSTTPPSSPPPHIHPLPKSHSEPKHVRFAPLPPQPTRKRGLTRIRTKEEVEEDFQAANAVATRVFDRTENLRKRERPDEDWDRMESLRKRVKRWHFRVWPEAYYEDV